MDKKKAWLEYMLFTEPYFKCNDIDKVENEIMEKYEPCKH